MKTAVVVCAAVALLALVESAPQEPQRYPRPLLPVLPYPKHGRGCLFNDGQCYEVCKEGEHLYVIQFCGHLMPERTCDDPNPVSSGTICDYFRCDCDEPKVRNPITRECVLLEDCWKKTENVENLTETDPTERVRSSE